MSDNSKIFTSFEDIEMVYNIRFDKPTSGVFEKDIVNLYNTGNIDIEKCENDLTGTLYCNLGNFERFVNNNQEKSKELYNIAISKYKNYKACFCLAQLIEDSEEKIKLIELSIEYGNKNIYIYSELARLLLIKNAKLGNTDIKSLQKQTSLLHYAVVKNSPDALYTLGLINCQDSYFDDAIKYLNSAIDFYSNPFYNRYTGEITKEQQFLSPQEKKFVSERINKCNELLKTIHEKMSSKDKNV